MKIIKDAYITLIRRQKEISEEIEKSSQLLQQYKADGDLSENNDYIQEKQHLENLIMDKNRVDYIIKDADILERERTREFTTIDLGCDFYMTVKVKGNFFKFTVQGNCPYKAEYDEEKQVFRIKDIKKNVTNSIEYNAKEDETSISGVFCFGGPTDICSEENILSSLSPLGKLLLRQQIPQGGFLRKELKELNSIVEVRGCRDNDYI